MKFKVVISSLFVDGKKKNRGDIVDLTQVEAAKYGVNLEPHTEPKVEPVEKPKVVRKPSIKKVAKSED
jgi:hypothetical protein